MIRLCERCFGQIGEHEPVLRRAYLHHTDHDGTSFWVYSYVHRHRCATPRLDTGAWDAMRSVGFLRLRSAVSAGDVEGQSPPRNGHTA